MELSGSTYDVALRGAFGTSRQPPERGRPEAASAFPGRAAAGGPAEQQQGIQRSDSSGQEFQPYAPGQPARSQGGAAGAPSAEATGRPEIAATPDARRPSGTSDAKAGEAKAQDPQVQAEVAKLKAAEEKVKAHEAAHKSAGGTMTGPVSYTYTRGPDGRQYVTGGEVPITISAGRTPQETVGKMQQVIRAALAPSDPSPQDRAIAAQATTQLQKAQQQAAAATAGPAPGAPPDAAAAAAGKAGSGRETDSGQENGETGTTAAEGAEPFAGEQANPVGSVVNSSDTRPQERVIRRSAPDRSRVDAVAAEASRRAYADPAVTGKDSNPSPAVVQTGPNDTASGYAGSPAVQTIMTPGRLTGFGAPRPLSYYA